MKFFKPILSYIIWTIIAFICAFGYMRIILGAEPKPSKGILKMFDWIYQYAFIHVGSIIGSIIALLYILIDIFYLKKRLQNSPNSLVLRLLIIIAITIIVATTHYVLEKVIDII